MVVNHTIETKCRPIDDIADLSSLRSGEWESDDTAAREGRKIKIRYGLQVSLKQI